MKKFRAISLAVILGLSISSVPAVAVPKPTLAEIEAAKKLEAEKKKIADAQAAKLAKANQSLRALTATANAATALYRKAQAELAVATALANAAAKHAAETAAAVAEAHKTIGRLAANAYIMGGSMSDIQPLLSADGPQDLIDQLSTLSTLGAQNSVALARFKEAEAAAKKAKAAADAAKAVQQIATDKVAAAKKIADDAKAVLAAVASRVRNNPGCNVVVVGYCAADKREQQMSWDRVNAIITYMVDKEGISQDRFIFNYGQQGGDCNTVDLRAAVDGETGPNRVDPPHPNLRKN